MSLDGRSIAQRRDRGEGGSRSGTGLPLGGMFFPNHPESVPLVRSFIGLITCAYGVAHVGETARLLASELAGNAVTHAGGTAADRFEVVATRRDDRLRVEVRDGSHDMPVMRYGDLLDESGRGLFLVAEFATDCGRYELPNGKAVWFKLVAWDCIVCR